MSQFCLLILVPLCLAFNFEQEIKKWELNSNNIQIQQIYARDQLILKQALCQKELNQKAFPYFCLKFQYLLNHFFEKQLNFKRREINKLCLDGVGLVSSIEKLETVLGWFDTESECSEKVKLRLKILKYKTGI